MRRRRGRRGLAPAHTVLPRENQPGTGHPGNLDPVALPRSLEGAGTPDRDRSSLPRRRRAPVQPGPRDLLPETQPDTVALARGSRACMERIRGMSAAIGVLLMAYGGPDTLEDVPGSAQRHRVRPRNLRRPSSKRSRNTIDGSGESHRFLSHGRRRLEALPPRGPGGLAMLSRHAPLVTVDRGCGGGHGGGRDQAGSGYRPCPPLQLHEHGALLQKVALGQELYKTSIEFAFVKSYHDSPTLVEALARRVTEAVGRWRPAARRRAGRVLRAQPPRAHPCGRGSVRLSASGDRAAGCRARRNYGGAVVVELYVRGQDFSHSRTVRHMH